MDFNAELMNGNVNAFLRMIRLGEGTEDPAGYYRLVGGGAFSDDSHHPNKRIWIERYKVWSTAAGAYQIIFPTWSELASTYGFEDFKPLTQDMAAVALIARRKALALVRVGRVEEAIEKCRLEWASLPGSPYGQRTESLESALAEYKKHGGDVA